ncbi:hypothetical protein HNP37_002192 [Flavobacterium nitrogenifigens]|uniref:DUF6965 domain-containing protein n=2 Tax=Flavobacterium TaxID=237 RepID=A0A7W7IWY3_9FLAO|nr:MULTISPECIES: hypothetical protein [Flavobacterium]MBB4802119.1 hypothetical protein [Flavobacterium nitrogenifigens]MBB6387077.1 hypothetical protein [Flavobacterium notoginsengisoli]
MNYEDIKRHFETNPPPKEVKWTEWAYISDTQVFLKSCYTTIRNYNGPMDRCPAWWHLRDFYILLKKTQQSAAPSEIQIGEPSPQQHPAGENAPGETAAAENREQLEAEI